MEKLKIYIGWDPRERKAYDTARKSILQRTKAIVNIIPLELSNPKIKSILTRPIEQKDGKLWCPVSQAPMSTEFAISRFCVPFLQKTGWGLYCDCDILCRADIQELFNLADDRYAVMVVKHNHHPKDGTIKMDSQIQTCYPRKNWSSVVLWNCEHSQNKKLTLDVLNLWPGRELHAFHWLKEDVIGSLPKEWNHLVGVDPPNPKAKLAHFTLGLPNMAGYENCEFSSEWREEDHDIRPTLLAKLGGSLKRLFARKF